LEKKGGGKPRKIQKKLFSERHRRLTRENHPTLRDKLGERLPPRERNTISHKKPEGYVLKKGDRGELVPTKKRTGKKGKERGFTKFSNAHTKGLYGGGGPS